MSKSLTKRPVTPNRSDLETGVKTHWSQNVYECDVSTGPDGTLNLLIEGGSDNGEFPYFGELVQDRIVYITGRVEEWDIVLEIQGQKVAGYTQRDVVAWLNHCCRSGSVVNIKAVRAGYLTTDLRQYLNTRFQKGSLDHDLQNTIRDNLYLRTVPCTTRSPREGEVNGVDYTFLTPEEFIALDRSGNLLESGVYEGNHYGTPKPLKESPLSPPRHTSSSNTSCGAILPGAHPSSEGKRRRNRSNVEAMAAKSVEPVDTSEFPLLGQPSSTRSSTPMSALSSRSGNRGSGNIGRGDPSIPWQSSASELGPLPTNWEKAYTENGEPYFIDHNAGISQWLDPRISKMHKKMPEDYGDSELPFGWERIDDPHYGTYYIDHVNRRTQYENPVQPTRNLIHNAFSNDFNHSWHQRLERSSNSVGLNTSSLSGHSAGPDVKLQHSLSQEQSNQHSSRNNSLSNTVNSSSSQGQLGTGHTNNNPNTRKPPYIFTRNVAELHGEFIRTSLVKSTRGFGFTIVGGDDEAIKEFLQIKSVVPSGPAWYDGKIQTGDVLVHVNNTCVLGYTHSDVVSLFQSIPPGEVVYLEVCRGYPLPFDPNDPNTEIVTTVAVTMANTKSSDSQNVYSASGSSGNPNNSRLRNPVVLDSSESVSRPTKSMPDLSKRQSDHSHPQRHNSADLLNHTSVENTPDILDFSPQSSNKSEFFTVEIVKGNAGFGFTIADSAYGQKVKKILDKPRCKLLQEGDILVDINGQEVRGLPHADVVQELKDCPCGDLACITVQRGGIPSPVKGKGKTSKLRSSDDINDGIRGNDNTSPLQPLVLSNSSRHSESFLPSAGVYRSKTPTADLYSSRDKEAVSINRPKTPLVDTRNWSKLTNNDLSSNINRSSGSQTGGSTNNSGRLVDSTLNKSCDQGVKGSGLYGITSDKRGNPAWYSENGKEWMRDSGRQHESEGAAQRDTFNDREDHNDDNHRNASVSLGQEILKSPHSAGSGNSFSYEDSALNRTMYNHYKQIPSEETDSYVPHQYNLWMNNSHSQDYGRTGSNQSHESSVAHNHNKLPLKNSSFYQHASSGYYGPLSNSVYSGIQTSQVSQSQDSASLPISYRESHPTLYSSSVSSYYSPNILSRSGLQFDSLTRKKHSTSFEHEQPVSSSIAQQDLNPVSNDYSFGGSEQRLLIQNRTLEYIEMTITLQRQESGFGFRIVGGTEEGSQVSIGHIVPGGAADLDGRLNSGDEIVAVDGQPVLNTSHHHVVQLMGSAALNGRVTLNVRRPVAILDSSSHSKSGEHMYPCDVTVTRNENEGFGFVIISSVSRAGSTIGRIIEGSPAERCGRLHVGDRILAVNGISILNLHHGEIVNLIKDSGYSVTLTIGPPQDDTESTASTSQRGEDQSLEQEDQYYAVELHRGTRGFGFSIRGGQEFQNMPLFVLRIAENGPAHQDGRLQVGDQIIEINGTNTKNMTHAEAIEIIRQGGNSVRLLVRRGNKLPSVVVDQSSSLLSTSSPGVLSPVLSAVVNGPISQSSPRVPSQSENAMREIYNWSYEPQ